MMTWSNAAWWLGYIFVAIAFQSMLPGTDFFLPGLILALQERHLSQVIFLGAVGILLQEGMGSMAFGGSLLWYAAAAILFFAGSGLLQGTGFMFVTLFGIVLSVVHYLIFSTLASLQDIPWNSSPLLHECIQQALCIPLMWLAASSTRRMVVHEDRNRQ